MQRRSPNWARAKTISDAARHFFHRASWRAGRFPQRPSVPERTALAGFSDADGRGSARHAETAIRSPKLFLQASPALIADLAWYGAGDDTAGAFWDCSADVLVPGFLRQPDRDSVRQSGSLVVAVRKVLSGAFDHFGGDGWRHQDITARVPFAQRNWGVLVCERARRPGPDISRRNSTSARLSVKIVTNWSDPTRMPNLAGAASLLSVGAHAQRSPLVSWGSGQPLAHSENLLGVPRRKAVTLRQSLTSCQAALGRRASSLGRQIRAPTLQRRLQPVPLPLPGPSFEPIRWLFPYRIRMQENSARFEGFPRN